MAIYYVATLARYVLVEAENELDAHERGHTALHELYADLRSRLGQECPIEIRTVRLAIGGEIEMVRWHQEMLDREAVVDRR